MIIDLNKEELNALFDLSILEEIRKLLPMMDVESKLILLNFAIKCKCK